MPKMYYIFNILQNHQFSVLLEVLEYPNAQNVLNFQDHVSNLIIICSVIFDAEQVYLKLQATNFKIKEVTTNPKLQTLKKIDLLKTLTLNPKSL